ncbi:MAG: hypothetical protein A2X48_13805 [Lentisphaerae bacterium GWF2_49_21]|nr:MAG: hypothetical protein A2X48_13805 [Lentisphaerae bacterium GWF2_49_21]
MVNPFLRTFPHDLPSSTERKHTFFYPDNTCRVERFYKDITQHGEFKSRHRDFPRTGNHNKLNIFDRIIKFIFIQSS